MNLKLSSRSSFDSPSFWENDRSKLHHNDFHHGFYHYLGAGETQNQKSTMMADVLSGRTAALTVGVARAIEHWPGISAMFHDLFNRAGSEAITDPTAALAQMAMKQMDSGSYPPDIVAEVKSRAQEVIITCSVRDQALIASAIEEPKRLLVQIDEFVSLFAERHQPIPIAEAELKAQTFMDNCRKFDLSVTAIKNVLLKKD